MTVDLESKLNRISNDDGVFNGIYTGSFYNERMRQGQSTVKLHVFLDGSILDVFVNDHYAFSTRVYPTDTNAVGVEAFSTGTTTFTSLKAWKVDLAQQSTGIRNVETTNLKKRSNVLYNLMGQRLSTVPRNGVYVCNGKKYVAR